MSPRKPNPHRRSTWVPGPPPFAGGPPPWTGHHSGERWTILEYYHSWVGDTLYISFRTDIPCHLWLYWTDKEEHMHERTKVVRGLRKLTTPDYCLSAWRKVEQNEDGDTAWHTFNFASWSHCEHRWWFFFGTEGEIESPSSSPIFTAHYLDFEKGESMRHIDLTHKEVAGVIDHADNSVTADKLEHDLDGVTIGLDADKVDGLHASEITPGQYCRVRRTALQNIGNNVWTPIVWQHVEFESEEIWGGLGNPTKLFIPKDGVYSLHGCIGYFNDPAGSWQLSIVVNTALHVARAVIYFSPVGNVVLSASSIWQLEAGNWIELYTIQDTGGNKATIFEVPSIPHLAIHRLS